MQRKKKQTSILTNEQKLARILPPKKLNLLEKIFRFFFPKDWKGEMIKGRIIGEQIREGRLTPKMLPTYWLGKGIRKVIDPKKKLKFGGRK